MTTRWEQWRTDTPEQQTRNIARDLDDNDSRSRRHDTKHTEEAEDTKVWRQHIDAEIEGMKKFLMGFILTSSGIIIVAAVNVAVLIARG